MNDLAIAPVNPLAEGESLNGVSQNGIQPAARAMASTNDVPPSAHQGVVTRVTQSLPPVRSSGLAPDDPEWDQLVTDRRLLEILFSEDGRPSLRWLHKQKDRRAIPFVKIDGLLRFVPRKVRDTLEKR
jgi:hypothetical protein